MDYLASYYISMMKSIVLVSSRLQPGVKYGTMISLCSPEERLLHVYGDEPECEAEVN